MDQPSQTPANQQEPVAPQGARISKRTVWALVCLIAPTILGILGYIVGFAANNALSPSDYSDNPFTATDPTQIILNITSLALSGISSITWLPGVVLGIVLLATKPTAPQTSSGAETQTAVTPEGVAANPATTPQSYAATPAQLQELASRKAKYLTWGLVSLVAPILFGIIAIILFFESIGWGYSSSTGNQADITHIVLTIVSVLAWITFIPGIVVGIILLVKRAGLQPKL